MKQLTFFGFLIRLFFSLLLVFASYNPTEYNLISWLESGAFSPAKGLTTMIIIIGWVIYIRASLRSLGTVGMLLVAVFFAFLVWLFIDLGWLSLKTAGPFTWVLLVILSFILAIGMSWSHIRRRMSGQFDTDDVDN